MRGGGQQAHAGGFQFCDAEAANPPESGDCVWAVCRDGARYQPGFSHQQEQEECVRTRTSEPIPQHQDSRKGTHEFWAFSLFCVWQSERVEARVFWFLWMVRIHDLAVANEREMVWGDFSLVHGKRKFQGCLCFWMVRGGPRGGYMLLRMRPWLTRRL